MIISHKHKFISLDPPKTGTNYRQNMLWNYGDYITDLQHANLAEVQNYFHEFDLSDYFTFTFVRNPWKRYLSWFNFLNRDNPKNNISPETFHRFMFPHLSETSRTKDLRITLPQSFWFQEQGKVNVDFIGCLENITEDMKLILNKINLPLTLPSKKSNTSKRIVSYQDFYNQELIDLVAKKEKSVIELKGYKF